MKRYQKALNGLMGKAESFASYGDGSDYFDQESGNLISGNTQGMTRAAKRPLMVIQSHQNPGRKLDRAQFDINITRNTAAIAQPLQVALFGTTHLRSGYSQFIINPAGVTNTVVGGLNTPTAGTTDRIRFTYTDGVGTDFIDITCNQVPYPVFLEALSADIFRISNIRYRLVNNANTIQFSQAHKFQSKSLFGKGSDDDLNVGAYLKPEQFQTGVIDIPIAADVDKETMLMAYVSQLAVAYPFTFTLSVFVEKFDKHDRLNANLK